MEGKYENIAKKRAENVKLFEATMNFNNELPSLKKAIFDSIEKTEIANGKNSYSVIRSFNNDDWGGEEPVGIQVNSMTTIEAARDLERRLRGTGYPYKIGILNFASATTVGGGTSKGANAQEESICRVSTLYPVLNSDKVHEGYYLKNRICGTRCYEDICVYSPDIIIFREDGMKEEEILPEVEWTKVDVLTCPAPNLRKDKNNKFDENNNDGIIELDEGDLRKLLVNRINLILYTAAAHKITHIVLGAFGCGAFKNPPKIVAEAFYEVLVNQFMKLMFREINFSIPYNEYNKINHDTFKLLFDKYKETQELIKKYNDEHDKILEDFTKKMNELFEVIV